VVGFVTDVGTSGSVARELLRGITFLIIGTDLKALTTPCVCVRLLTDN
jgi:hypothetical protein